MFISLINDGINNIVTIDYMSKGSATLLHVMNVATRFCVAYIVSSANPGEVVTGFE